MKVMILQKNSYKKQKKLDNLALGLLEYETLTGEEITKVMNGESLVRNEEIDDIDDNDKTLV